MPTIREKPFIPVVAGHANELPITSEWTRSGRRPAKPSLIGPPQSCSFDHPTARGDTTTGYIHDMIAGAAANGISDLIRVDTDTDFGVVGTAPSTGPTTLWNDAQPVHLTTAGDDLVRSRWVQPVMSAW